MTIDMNILRYLLALCIGYDVRMPGVAPHGHLRSFFHALPVLVYLALKIVVHPNMANILRNYMLLVDIFKF